VLYSDATGGFTFVDNTFALPTAMNCNGFESTIDAAFGLPDGPGANSLVASGSLSPIVTRAVRAVLATSPVSGTAPLTVNFNAAGSQAVAGIASYSFDFNGDGVFDQTGTAPTASFAYAKLGRYKVTLRVADTEGDSDVTSQIVTVAASAPTVSGVGLAARAFRAKQGTTLKLTLSQPATGHGPDRRETAHGSGQNGEADLQGRAGTQQLQASRPKPTARRLRRDGDRPRSGRLGLDSEQFQLHDRESQEEVLTGVRRSPAAAYAASGARSDGARSRRWTISGTPSRGPIVGAWRTRSR
jgi:PKD repeat protein